MKYKDKYFKDYKTYPARDGKGKGKKIICVYKGDIFQLKATKRQRVIKKLACSLLILAYFAFALIAGFQQMDGNKGYAVIPYIALLVFGLYCGLGIINLDVTKKDMSEFEYTEYSNQIRRGSILSIFSTGITFIIYAAFLFVELSGNSTQSADLKSEILALIFIFACLMSIIGIYFIEKKSEYIIIPAKKEIKEKKDFGEACKEVF